MAPDRDIVLQVLAQLVEAEKRATSSQESQQSYAKMHKARFAEILRLCRIYTPDASARVLDVGRSELTAFLAKFYHNIHSLGLDPSTDDGGHRENGKMDAVPHIIFDLLDSHVASSWPKCGRFDLIVFSEVIEHLCIAPEFVFAVLNCLLAEDGIIMCTTPNAADIAKRLRLIVGRNPYERLRLYPINPGHVREYTQQELCDIACSIGLTCVAHFYKNWIQTTGRNRIKSTVGRLFRAYPSFRPFQVCVLARNSSPNDCRD